MHSRIRHIIAQATTRYARLQGSVIYCDKVRSCKGSGSTIVAKAVEAFDPNAINRCRSKNIGVIGMIKRVACLVAQRRNDIRQTDIRWNPGVRSLPK